MTFAFAKKSDKKKKSKNLLVVRFKPNVGETANTVKKSTLTLNIKENMFFETSKF